MRKIIMILVMAMVAFGSFAKDFKYRSGDDEWEYEEKQRTLSYKTKFYDSKFYDSAYACEYNICTYDVSEEEAWKIINGEEFPTFEFRRDEWKGEVFAFRIPARDYTNRK